MDTPSELETLQIAIVRHLETRPILAGVPVMHERLLNVQAQVASALNQLKGIAALVLTPTGENTTPAANVNLRIRPIVEVVENVVLNTSAKGTKLPASFVAEQVAAHLNLHLWTAGKALTVVGIGLVPNRSLVVYRVTLETRVKLVAL